MNTAVDLMRVLPLTPEGVERIHQNALTLLCETGIRVHHADTRRLFQDAGAIQRRAEAGARV